MGSTIGNYRGPKIVKVTPDTGSYFNFGSSTTVNQSTGNVNDSTGSGISGNPTNGVTYDNDGGGSAVFDGVDDFIDNVGTVNNFNYHNANAFSVCFWFKLNQLNRDHIIVGSSITTIDAGFYIGFRYINSFFGLNALLIGGHRGTVRKQVFNGGTNDNIINDTNWHFAAYTNNNQTVGQWYVDGVSVTTFSRYNPASADEPDGIKPMVSASRTMNIGRSNYSSMYNPIKGKISSLLFYNRALTSAEVLSNFNATKSNYGY